MRCTENPNHHHIIFYFSHTHTGMHTCMHAGSISIDFLRNIASGRELFLLLAARRGAARRQNENRTNKQHMYPQLRSRPLRIPQSGPICPTLPSPPPAPPSTGTFSSLSTDSSRLSSSAAAAAAAAVAPRICTLHHKLVISPSGVIDVIDHRRIEWVTRSPLHHLP
jgi:hypothetical protein